MIMHRLRDRLPGLLSAALALGVCLGAVATALAARPYNRHCPPGYRNYYPEAPNQEAMSPDTSPSDQAATDPDQPSTDDLNLQDPGAQPASTSLASLSPGGNTPMLGRLDQNNRFNLFDSHSAIPTSRIWYGFQWVDGYNLSVFQTGTTIPVFTDENNDPITKADEVLHRVGFEYALFDDFSVSFQAQYYAIDDVFAGNVESPDSWSNPQVMLKYALLQHRDFCLSAVLGATFETDTDIAEFTEDTTRLYPGMLFHQQLYDDLFCQGGFQFGLPTDDDQIETFDWSLGLGYWLYQDPCYSACGGCGGGHGRILRGVVLQVEFLGKHVIGDNVILDPFELDEVFAPGFAEFREDEDVVDLTIGFNVLFYDGVRVGLGYSAPVTDDEAREGEFLTTIGYGY